MSKFHFFSITYRKIQDLNIFLSWHRTYLFFAHISSYLVLIFCFFHQKFQVGEPFICKNDKKLFLSFCIVLPRRWIISKMAKTWQTCSLNLFVPDILPLFFQGLFSGFRAEMITFNLKLKIRHHEKSQKNAFFKILFFSWNS